MTTPDNIYADILAYRATLSTETDGDSPDNENTYGALRNCIESLTEHSAGRVETMTLTSDPADAADGLLTDTGQAFTPDDYIGFLAVVEDGDGIGNIFYVEGNAATTVTCYTVLNGDSGGINPNLYSAGVRSGDTVGIWYHFLTASHNHNGLNSARISESIDQAALKTSTGEISRTSSGGNQTLPGGEYGFYSQIKSSGGNVTASMHIAGTVGATYLTRMYLLAQSGTTAYAQQRYVTASGDIHWLFIMKDKTTGRVIASYQAPDHPCMGNGNRPELVPHPFDCFEKDGKMVRLEVQPDEKLIEREVEILVINPSMSLVEEATARTIPVVGGGYLTAKRLREDQFEVDGTRPVKGLLEVFEQDFEIDESRDADWPDIPITVGLPTVLNGEIVNNYIFRQGEKVKPLRRVIEKPSYITSLNMKLKEA